MFGTFSYVLAILQVRLHLNIGNAYILWKKQVEGFNSKA